VPVHLSATLTEIGTLELFCVSNASDARWRLEFELRGATARPDATVTEALPARFAEARELIERAFSRQPAADAPQSARQLFAALEQALGPREDWRLPLLRELWSTLFAVAKKRRSSAQREHSFFQLAGYCLRPGFGYPLDEWRCSQTFTLFAEGLVAVGEHPVWNAYWVMWRRIAGGLTAAQHQTLWRYLQPYLAQRIPPTPRKAPLPKGVRPEGLDEMVRTAAALEHLDVADKSLLGGWIAERLKNPQTAAGPWAWALGRLGAREPLYGSGHKIVATAQAEEWLALLLTLDWHAVSGAAFAAAQLARPTGDRTRDLADALRSQTVAALTAAEVPGHWLRLVTEGAMLDVAEAARALGDTLPLGLQLR